VQDNPPDGVLFRRSGSTKPLPDPTSEGSLDPLRQLLGYEPDDHRWKLVRGWLVGAAVPDIARPVLLFVGQPGCAKTTRGRLTLSVLEPHTELGSSFGKNIKDDQVKALGRYLVGYDNINSVSEAVSDHLCRLVTGDEVDTRKLYTDSDMRTISYRRSGVLTALAMPNLRADALQRLIVVTVDPITEDERKGENGFLARFAEQHPVILAGLCDALAGMLARLPDARAESRKRPRMADYADVLAAYDEAAARAYEANDREGMVDAAEASPFVGAVCRWLEKDTKSVAHTTGPNGSTVQMWEGTPTEAWKLARQHLATLDDWDRQRTAPAWPVDAARFVDELTVVAAPLRAVGVTFERRKSNGRRVLQIRRVITDSRE
jgi:hypothetical protein